MKLAPPYNSQTAVQFAVIPCAPQQSQTGNMDLSKVQIKRLRAVGHRLKMKPIVIVGQKGLNDSIQLEIDVALNHHELLKLRIPALDKSEKKELMLQICDQHQANLIEAIGNVMVIYRRNIKSEHYGKLLKD